MGSIVLLGDSIFDNAAYVGPGEEVASKLEAILPPNQPVVLAARDGAIIGGVAAQLRDVPEDATHLFVSAGGNDALRQASVLRQPVRSVGEAMAAIAAIRDRFSADYRAMLDALAGLGRPIGIATIYEAQLPDATERRLANTALGVLNDVITREAARRRLPLLDLRVLFDEAADYANAIEPSGHGGEKLARVIAAVLSGHDFGGPSSIYV